MGSAPDMWVAAMLVEAKHIRRCFVAPEEPKQFLVMAFESSDTCQNCLFFVHSCVLILIDQLSQTITFWGANHETQKESKGNDFGTQGRNGYSKWSLKVLAAKVMGI